MLIFMEIKDEASRNKIETIYRTYRMTMFFAAKQIVKDNSLAEDAVAQAFLKLIQISEKISMENCNKLRSFLVLITKRYAINIYNARKNSYAVSIEDIELDNEITDSTLDRIISEEDVEKLQQLIASLPAKYADVLKLKYAHQFTDKEIASILDISDDNVRIRLHRARNMLKEKLQIHGKQEV